MSKQQIFPGSSPNDGTGDTLYQGALKINSNFNEIYTTFGDGTNLYNVTGPQGAIGPQGAQGSQGSQGFQGSQGSQGSQGFQGSQGSQGSQGLQGPQGAQGNQGSQGIVGPQGAQGLQGIVGPQGSQGVGGPQGFLGPQGSQGFQGVPGSNGSSTHQWTTTPVGIHTLSNVGIGTTNSTSGLTVKGNVSVSGVSTFSNNFNIDNSIIELSHTVAVRSAASGNLTAYFDESGTVTLLHENVPRLITTNEGLDILGTASVTNDINVSGLTTTTNLYVSGVSTFIDDIVAYDSYGAALVWDSSQSRLEFASGKALTFGDSVAPQLEIFNIANSESSIIATGGVPLTIKTSSSASTLGNATTKLSVSGIGITVTGTTFTNQLSVSGVSTFANTIEVGTGKSLTFGSAGANYLKLYSDGSNTYINQQNMGKLIIDATGTQRTLEITDSQASQTMAKFIGNNGPVELYHSGSKKFETLGAGVTVTGTTFTNQLSVSGVSTFKNTVSVDNYLVVNQTSTNPSVTVDVGGNTAIAMYYDTSSLQSYLYSGNKNLNIKVYSPQNVNIMSGDYNLASFNSNSAAQLYKGVIVTGSTTTDQLSVSGVSTFIGSVGIGTTNPLSGYNLTVGNDSLLSQVSNSLKVHGYGEINGLIIKGNSTTGTTPYYTNNVIITQHPATTFTGDGNVAIGDYSFTKPGAAKESVALGYFALNSVGNNITNSAFAGNTGIGAYAGQDSTTTIYNTLIGWSAGRYITTGDYNVILGSYDGNSGGLDIRTSSNNIILSDGAGNIRLYTNSSGNTGIGTTNPTEKLDVAGSVKVGINTSQGVILTSPNGTKYQLFVENDGTLKTVAV
jgi:hypothetical protein